jgi:hypothetical protein
MALVHPVNNGCTEARFADERDNTVEHICDELDPVTKKGVSGCGRETVKEKIHS